MAIASLCVATPYNGTMLASFLKAGGVAAVLHVLNSTSCPVTLGYTADLMRWLVSDDDFAWTRDQDGPVADKFFASGECELYMANSKVKNL